MVGKDKRELSTEHRDFAADSMNGAMNTERERAEGTEIIETITQHDRVGGRRQDAGV